MGASETAPVALPYFDVIDTGDPLPEGCDSVVMREHVRLLGPHSSGLAETGLRVL